MKFSAILLLVLLYSSAYSQNFTKITAGPVVNDGGASRSVNWIDIDNDNDLDLFISNGKQGGENNFLYRNDNGTFVKVTGTPVTMDNNPSDGASFGDYDNDGNIDFCVVTWYDSLEFLYKNNAAWNFNFLNSSNITTSRGYSETCSWGDFNNDGLLDLVITNSGNNAHPNRPEFLYKNNGDGSFTKIDTGIVVTDGKFTRGCNWVDVDNDRDLDLFVCNERNQAENLFINHGSGYFTKLTGSPLVNTTGESWSASWGDYDNDGDPDVVVANFDGQQNYFFRNDGNLTFTKIDTGAVVTEFNNGSCTGWGDFDNDGDIDLFITNSYASGGQALKNFLFKNMLMETGTAYFEKVTTGDIVNDESDSYGFAWGDYDRDGDLDMCVATTRNENSNNFLYRNDNSNGNKWVNIKCVGVNSNRSGIGARVRVKAVINGSPVWQMRDVEGQSGYCGQNLELHFGLGNTLLIDSIRIEWPSGVTDNFINVQPGNFYKAIEGQTLSLGINSQETQIPEKFTLYQNFPNPFNPETVIKYEVSSPQAIPVKLSIYNSEGKEVALLVSSFQKSGSYEVKWDAGKFSSGVYYAKLTSENNTLSQKMVLLK